MKKLLAILLVCLPVSAFDFNISWEWDNSWISKDSFTETNSIFSNIKGFNIYRGETPTNFVLVSKVGPTNFVRMTNQPTTAAFFFVRTIRTDGSESEPSNTNHFIPPQPLNPVAALFGSR